MIINLVDSVGTYFLNVCNQLGNFSIFLFHVLSNLFSNRPNFKQITIQIQHIGVESFTIVVLTGLSSGFALALQCYMGLSKFGGEELIGLIVAIGITRELAPVLTGIMVTGRAGSAMAAEIGSMKITEQIDALKTICVNPYRYIIIPRIIASTVILPFLTVLSMICGIVGGYIYSTSTIGINSELYLSTIESNLLIWDIIGGVIKASVFGFILSVVGTYMGYQTSGGAQNVGVSTTKSVVIGSIMILISNYFLNLILFNPET